MIEQATDGRRTAKIYFKRGSEALAKDLAASIRNQRSHAHLVDQHFFVNEENVLACDAVLIQAEAPKARLIGNLYQQFGNPGVEVVFFDNTGKITKLDLVEPATSFATMLGGNDESETAETGGPADTEQPASGLLEETGPDGGTAGTEAAGPADIEGGNSAENADNTES